MVHRRASVRRYQRADPVYFCFCNMAQFKQYKLGFDRMFHIGEVETTLRVCKRPPSTRNKLRSPASAPELKHKKWRQRQTRCMQTAAMKPGIAPDARSAWRILKHQS